MSDFLKEVFRPNTPEEEKVIGRLVWRKTVVNLLFLAAVVVVAGIVLGSVLFSKVLTYAPYRGTWIAAEELADGFHAEDRYLECNSNEVLLNGQPYGTMKTRDGKQFLSAKDCYGDLTIADDTLTVAYTLPEVTEEAEQQVDTYIRISRKTGLTQEERDEMY